VNGFSQNGVRCGGRQAACLVGWLGMAAALTAAPAHGGAFPPSETIFPATTRAWISVASPKAFGDSFTRCAYGQLVNDPAMKPFVESFRKQLADSSGKRLAKLGLTLDDLEKLPGGEVAAAAIEPKPGDLATVMVVDTTGHDAETSKVLETISQRMTEQKATKVAVPGLPAEITVYQLPPETGTAAAAGAAPPRVRRVVIGRAPAALVVGDDAAVVAEVFGALAKGRADSLATLPAYIAVAKRCGKEVTPSAAPLRWFVDPLGYAKAYQAANPLREKRKGPDFVAILARQGFDAVRGAGGLVVFDDGTTEMRHHSMIYAPPLAGRQPFSPERFDLAARMLQFPDADPVVPPAWVPRDVSSWIAMQWDLQAAFASAESLVDDVVGEKGVFDDVIASLKEDPDGPQIDVEKDLVAALGQRVSVVSDYVEPLGVESERLVIAIEAVDPKRVAETVAKSMSTDPDMQKIEFNGHVIWELIDRSTAIPTLEIETPGLSVKHADNEHDDEAHRRRQRLREREEKLLPHSAVTVANGHLLIASNRDFLERVLTTKGGVEALASAADYAVTAAELKKLLPAKAAIRSFSREDESIRPAYELLKQGSMPKSKSVLGQLLNGILGDGKEGSVRSQKIDGSTLPEFNVIQRYLGTAAIGMESVPDGWYIAGMSLPRSQKEPGVAQRPAAPVGR
jgi:hypothetical protein